MHKVMDLSSRKTCLISYSCRKFLNYNTCFPCWWIWCGSKPNFLSFCLHTPHHQLKFILTKINLSVRKREKVWMMKNCISILQFSRCRKLEKRLVLENNVYHSKNGCTKNRWKMYLTLGNRSKMPSKFYFLEYGRKIQIRHESVTISMVRY